MDITSDRPLCTIELIAEGSAERCPGAHCPFWEEGCVLDQVTRELSERREVAGFLLGLRRTLERSELEQRQTAVGTFHRRLAAGTE